MRKHVQYSFVFLWMAISFVVCNAQRKIPTLREMARTRDVHRTAIVDYRGCCADFEELLRKSDLIIRARVIDGKPRLSPDERGVWTDYNAEIVRIYKDTAASFAVGAHLTIPKRGGQLVVNSHTVEEETPNFPSLAEGKTYIFFLSKCVNSCTFPYLLMGNAGALSVESEGAACKSRSPALHQNCGLSISDLETAINNGSRPE